MPELYDAFMQILPFPEITRIDGLLNPGIHFPKNGVIPDLGEHWSLTDLPFCDFAILTPLTGPKMYNAEGTILDGHSYASTKLHMDVTDAFNLMMWCHNRPAVWDIFQREDVPALRKILKDHPDFNGKGDPILSQSIFLTDAELQSLSEEHGIRAHRIFQKKGEGIVVPPGCPHQVSHLHFTLEWLLIVGRSGTSPTL